VGGGKSPLSLGILAAAAEWGCPPWQIAGGDPLDWYFKWQFWQEQRAKARE